MKKRIFIQDWLMLKPYDRQSATDNYYLKLSNEVKIAISKSNYLLALQKYLDDKGISELSCFLVSYFEDIISDTNFWNSFVSIHKRLYKKQLPFYVLNDYFEKEINPQDISFLIWYFLNTKQMEKFIFPYNSFITEIAFIVYDIFDNAWDDAPENAYLKSFYQIDENENDYYAARQIMDIVLFQSYLFYTDTSSEINEKEQEIINEKRNDERLLTYLRENRDSSLCNLHTRLLSLTCKEWLSEIVKDKNSLSNDIINISQRISGSFLYKGQDKNDIFLEHIASCKKIKLTKKSYDHSDDLKEEDTVIFIGIVRWKDEWWFSGIQFQYPFNPDLILNEKNSLESRMAVNFLDHQSNQVNEMLAKQLKAFKDFNNGKQIAFLLSKQIDEFIRGYINFYNETLELSEKEINEANERSRKDGLFHTEEKLKNFAENSDSGLVFFNPKSGCEIVMEVNSAFPLPDNPYFKNEDSETHIMRLFMDESISKELVMFCIEECNSKTNLPFFNTETGKQIFNDIDFLLRFWKNKNYYTKPSITFFGQEEK